MYQQTGNLVQELKHGVILQQVNAQGVMRSGIAKDIREKWPAVWEAYDKEINAVAGLGLDTSRHMGKVIPVEVEPGLWVLNIVGQQFYGRDGKRYTSYDALDTGLGIAGQFARLHGFLDHDIHHPLIGCGLGGGHWPVVSAIIEHQIGPSTTLWTLPAA